MYLATEANGKKLEQIDKFTAAGTPLEKTETVKYREAGEKQPETEELEAEETHGLTVAADGTVWLYYEEELYELSASHAIKQPGGEPRTVEPQLDRGSGLAADTAGRLLLRAAEPVSLGRRTPANVIGKLGPRR